MALPHGRCRLKRYHRGWTLAQTKPLTTQTHCTTGDQYDLITALLRCAVLWLN